MKQSCRCRLSVIPVIILFLIVTSQSLFAGTKLVEDWQTTPALDASWTNVGGNDQRVYIEGGELNMIIRPYSNSENGGNFSINARNRFLSSDYTILTRFQATMRMENVCDVAANSQFNFCAADFAGFFYNTNVSPSDAIGDVFFAIRFGDRGSGLEVWWEIREVRDANYDLVELLSEGTVTPPSGGWQLSTNYTVDITYDNNNIFSGSFGGQNIVNATGPAKGTSPHLAVKWIRARSELLEAFSGDPDSNRVHAIFDNIQIDTGSGLTMHDDFNDPATAMSITKWDNKRLLRESTISDGRVKVHYETASGDMLPTNGVRLLVGLPDQYQTTDFIQADMEITGGVTPDGTRGEIRLEGGMGNGKYSTDPGNSDGQLNITLRLRKRHNPPYEYDTGCWASRCENSDCSARTDYPWSNGATVNPDTTYTGSIRRNGTSITCKISEKNSGTVLVDTTLDLATMGISEIHQVSEYKNFRITVREQAGATEGYIDNVYVLGPGNLLLRIVPIISSLRKEKKISYQ